ncbi:non-hydrolyzing UDP-N-acetylglucosamine 2-epimerase [Cohnella thailandensis]|uniref:UDP-N-acetylglucosamine 2-epimerase (Non-hydrolyzing) n=1 Tax=Cohnella thailandensis TaxID=557557 RepID=A0A841T0R2_9BACL|nr:UDP-N-acetylglucosamine 2-epimerase (non-hydrolyzing) [Cohnella thailandensis]MBB6635670.1 UDP-N-acetylglucosamine 2-epimerase (non-hydrolyzing) [Cohnella thailandensis]MBP1976047.1 UDP-N-acetylglucosamine 2-epimerase (non-hydrolyzing) [Cohnella thailandensis]
MKIMTVLGTRPEIIRLSLIIPKLDRFADSHVLVHSGQNYDRNLSDIFFEQMGIRKPDVHIRLHARTFGQQLAQMFAQVEEAILREKPDRLLVLGDTNSALCALIGERMGIPVYHMEAGNRCYDRAVPEEINRRAIDSVSSCNMPYTPGSRENLLREGMDPQRVWMTGNPIYEVLEHYKKQTMQSRILDELELQEQNYVLVTAHRAENVDNERRLRQIVQGLHLVADRLQQRVICSIHPRTKDRLGQYGVTLAHPLVEYREPFGFFDFVKLQRHASCVITDSGTVQEESCIMGVPAVTIRQSTERPETLACGSNLLSGLEPERIAASVSLMLGNRGGWVCPEGYLDSFVSTKVVNLVLGGQSFVS